MNLVYSSFFFRFIGAASLVLVFAMPVNSEELNIKSVGDEPPNTAEGVLRPTIGMSMELVTQQFGEPQSQMGAVGEPPITRWVYENFVVFFEHNLVIHSVVPKK